MSEKGFSLVEMMAVLAVISVIAAMAMPAYIKMRASAQYREAGQGISNMMRDARTRAASQNQTFQVVINVSGGSYQLQDSGGGAVDGDWTPVLTDVRLASASDCSSTANVTIKFFPDGTSEAPGYVCILDNSGQKKFIVKVENSATGQVVVE